VRFIVEPSPAGGFQIRMQGSPAPLSRHDTEEEAEVRRAAYERGAGAPPRGEPADLADGSEVLVRFTGDGVVAVEPRTGAEVGAARYRRGRPGAAEAAVEVVEGWRGRGLGGLLLRRLCRRARADGIETFTATVVTDNRSIVQLFERLGRVETRGDTLEVELPVDDVPTLLRSAATGHVRT
jgi:L-amino acid N-acyltransferase YncA